MILEYFGTKHEYSEAITLLEILKKEEVDMHKYYCARVNNRLRELTYLITSDAVIEFFDLSCRDSMNIYQASLRYVFSYAVKKTFPKARVIFNYSISRAIFAQICNNNHPFNQNDLDTILKAFYELVEADLPIARFKLDKKEAMDIYKKNNLKDKVDVLKYRTEKDVNAYKCNDYINYMYSYMVPSTGFINKTDFRLYSPGLIIQYPRAELNGIIPAFDNELVLGKSLKEANRWGNITSSSYIPQLNKIIEGDKSSELINMCETKHNTMLCEIGSQIKADIDNIKLIAIAGPSSSGKTTFCNRLRIQLMTLGITPLMISIDDFYKPAEEAPLDDKGERDLEHIEALDLALFNNTMLKLIQGEEVTLPVFNFHLRKRENGRTVRLAVHQPILIEGIHALNERLTPSIPSSNKYKIYIAPQAQLHIDDQNPISMTDIRLIRRLVRDYRYRNSDPIETLSMWPSVRRGEFKWIYPFQEQADYVFNSELTYELSVLKKYAIEVLNEVKNDSKYFIEANRLLKFLKYFKDIDEKWIPCNSILREFIGGSIFYDN